MNITARMTPDTGSTPAIMLALLASMCRRAIMATTNPNVPGRSPMRNMYSHASMDSGLSMMENGFTATRSPGIMSRVMYSARVFDEYTSRSFLAHT